MPRYIPVKVQIVAEQDEKICKAIQNNKGVTIQFSKLDPSTTDKNLRFGILCLTNAQFSKVQKALPGAKFSFLFSKAQVKYNVKHKGGFLGLIAAVAAPLIAGIVGGLTEKAISGRGIKKEVSLPPLILHKPKVGSLKITKYAKGLYLSPYFIPHAHKLGTGLYLQRHTTKGMRFHKCSTRSSPKNILHNTTMRPLLNILA